MVSAEKFIEMQVCTRETGRTINRTGTGNSIRITEILMKVTLKTDSSMDRALNNWRMEAGIQVGSPKETSMGRGISLGPIVAGIKETLLTKIWKESARTDGQMARCTRVIGKMERCMELELLN